MSKLDDFLQYVKCLHLWVDGGNELNWEEYEKCLPIEEDGFFYYNCFFLIYRKVKNGCQPPLVICTFHKGIFSPLQKIKVFRQEDILHWARIIFPEKIYSKLTFEYYDGKKSIFSKYKYEKDKTRRA